MDKSKFNVEHPDFLFEAHEVITKDGYILTLLRIRDVPKDKKCSTQDLDKCESVKSAPRPPVLFVHGFSCSSEQWITNLDGGLPYRMAKDGYDCWLANLRGTPLSRGHTTISKNSKKYWDFSFHEIGRYDVPAMLDYILELTGFSNLLYIGHSMGCTVLLLAVEQFSEMGNKIELMIALAPAVFGSHVTNIYFRFLIPIISKLSKNKYFRTRELCGRTSTGYAKLMVFGSNAKTKSEKFGGWLCHHLGKQFGFVSHVDKVKDTQKSNVANTFPRPTSLKLFCHGLQTWHSGQPLQFNYGRSGNMKVYGTPKPPEYDFERVNIPVAIFYSDSDELCPPKDIEKLSTVLPNVVEYLEVKCPEFSHLDFLTSTRAENTVYDGVYEVLMKVKFKYNPANLGEEHTSL